jgi:type III pantothenate kinase
LLMPHFLCLDIGNSFVKAASFSKDEARVPPAEVLHIPTTDFSPGVLQEVVAAHRPEKAIVCSVGATDGTDVVDFLKAQGVPTLLFGPRTPLPISNAYRSSDTLGLDRLALAVGLAMEHPESNVLAISAGTCITYNFVTHKSAFRGGLITPGLHMRLEAMNHFTARLPLVPLAGDVPLLGYDTESSMRSGAILGAAVEIDGLVARYKIQYPEGFNAVLTGGDAAQLAPHLKSGIFADPFLLMKGLYRILSHNALFVR